MNNSGFPGTKRTILTVLGAITLATSTSPGQDQPATYDLSVVIRDFTRDHPDFNVVPAVGYGYYAGNVAYDLDSTGKPVFTGEGSRLGRLWKDKFGHPIAPHLFNTCDFAGGSETSGEAGPSSFRITVNEGVEIKKRSLVDSFDSNLGPYGGENVGESALIMANGAGRDHDDDDDDDDDHGYVSVTKRSTVLGDIMVDPDDDATEAVRVSRRSRVSGEIGNMETPAEIAAAEQPVPDLGPSVGKVRYRRGDHTLSEDLHCRKLELDKHATLTVTGDVTIWCDKKLEIEHGSILIIDGNVVIRCDRKFEMDDGSELRLMEGATLTLYVGRKLELDDRSMLNMNTGNPQLVSIVMMESDDHRKTRMELDDGSMAAAWVQGVDATLEIDDESEFFGSFMGRKVKVSDKSRLHVDMATGTSTGGGVVFDPVACELGDTPGTIITAATGDVLSGDTFYEWWRDVLGVNQSTVQTIRLVRSKLGVYSYIDDDYRPINGLLLGNEGEPNNYHLTVEIEAEFTYTAGAGQWFEIRCTDDAYLFVNGRLVIDLGGYGYNKVMFADMERLGLSDGETYRVRLFHAQRQQGLGIFRLQTNMILANRDGVRPAITGVLED